MLLRHTYILFFLLTSAGCANARVTNASSQEIAAVGSSTLSVGSNNTTITYFCEDDERLDIKSITGQATVLFPNQGTISFQNVSRDAGQQWPADAQISVQRQGTTYVGKITDVDPLNSGGGVIGAICVESCETIGQHSGGQIRIHWGMPEGTGSCG